MSGLLISMEEKRLRSGLTQGAVARIIGISQPHYSKVVGGLVPLAPELAKRVQAWVNAGSSRRGEATSASETRLRNAIRIRELSRSIERQLREINSLLEPSAAPTSRRTPTRTGASRSKK